MPTNPTSPSPTAEKPLVVRWQRRSIQTGRRSQTIDLAFLFDPMRPVHTSNVEPFAPPDHCRLESSCRVKPLQFVLADDPWFAANHHGGAFISANSSMRADAQRIVIVFAWQPSRTIARKKLWTKIRAKVPKSFHGNFTAISPSGNPFRRQPSTHHPSRPSLAKRRTARTHFGNVHGTGVFDEAAQVCRPPTFGNKLTKTETLRPSLKSFGAASRHLLLNDLRRPQRQGKKTTAVSLSLARLRPLLCKFPRDGVQIKSMPAT